MDGDLPLEFTITDRTRYERPLFIPPIPLAPDGLSGEEIAEHHLTNVGDYLQLANAASQTASMHYRIAKTYKGK